MKTGLCALLLTVAACAGNPQEASTSADQQYRKADARIRAMEDFEQLRAACAQAGRPVAIKRYSASRLPASVKDADGATCW